MILSHQVINDKEKSEELWGYKTMQRIDVAPRKDLPNEGQMVKGE